FLSKRIFDENRVLCVLSDGMGHGVRANVLATLTATMAINFSIEHKNAATIAEIIMKALPICSERDISYSTFTIIDVSVNNNLVSILEYDNPQTAIMRGSRIYEPEWKHVDFEAAKSDKRSFDIKACTFNPQKEDRIIFWSDGITQSGLGKGLAMGWGRNNALKFVRELIESNPTISAVDLSERIVKHASANDQHLPKDDITCGVIYFREPRKTMLCTGPPFSTEKDYEFAQILKNFVGRKIISGATTTEIIGRELHREVTNEAIIDPTLPPSSKMEGIDLVTEGVLTLSKVIYMLNAANAEEKIQLGKGPADQICKVLLESDVIYILVGTKINESHHDPSLPVEIEIRRNLIRRLTNTLSEKYMKVVHIRYM
ncbi:serine/threonine-protein phosphatase, partial [Bacteroidales bacterium OttesenSCG-928-L14]|nr:serine/threonine-protein phosphatase [Bacteroidales bacterium OttesenSCG-928-L14]